MGFNRLLRYLNIAIILVAIAAVMVFYWYAVRPMPRTSGTISVGVGAPVTVIRDRIGVPHISAKTEEDVYFAQGFVTAQDRMWQMEGVRRLAAGELAELGGPAALELDRDARGLRMRRIAEAAERALRPQERQAFAAYARGVNAYLATHQDRLPMEYRLAGLQPRAWRITDSILVGYHLYRTLSTSWKRDLDKAHMLESGNTVAVETLFPVRTGGEVHPGSNAWVISGKHTASGKPILANDMHLEFSIPGIWYETHLQVPGKLNVSGVAAPGLPGILAGHNDRIAWGITSLEFDEQDLYREQLDQAGRFLSGGQWHQPRVERETILVKGARQVDSASIITSHGPIVAREGAHHYSLRWTASDGDRFRFAFLEINRATDWQSFREALRQHPGPGLNLLYADVDGNIGYQIAGNLPVRRGFDGSVPLDGVSGGKEWDGFIPFDALPSVLNPASGIIVSANENLFPENFPYTVAGHFAPPYRSRQARAMLEKRQNWTAADMIAIQKDVYSSFLHFFSKQLLQAYDRVKPSTPIVEEAIPLLRNWNGQTEIDLPQPMIVTLAYQHFRRAVADVAAPGKEYRSQMAPSVVEKLLRERPAGWFDNFDQALLRELASGLEEGERLQGADIGKWRYGRYNRLAFVHPVGGRIRWVSKYFNIGPMEMSGSPTSVKQMTGRLGPSMRMAVDLADWDRSLLNVVTGQSGHVFSSHYKDHWDHYYVGQSFPMQFKQVEAVDTLHLTPLQR